MKNGLFIGCCCVLLVITGVLSGCMENKKIIDPTYIKKGVIKDVSQYKVVVPSGPVRAVEVDATAILFEDDSTLLINIDHKNVNGSFIKYEVFLMARNHIGDTVKITYRKWVYDRGYDHQYFYVSNFEVLD